MTSRTDIVGSNGNCGSHYLVEQVCRVISGDSQNQPLGGKSKGKRAWEQHIKQAIEIIDLVRNWDDRGRYQS